MRPKQQLNIEKWDLNNSSPEKNETSTTVQHRKIRGRILICYWLSWTFCLLVFCCCCFLVWFLSLFLNRHQILSSKTWTASAQVKFGWEVNWYTNNIVLFYVLFFQTGAQSPLQSKEHTHTHTHTHTHSGDSSVVRAPDSSLKGRPEGVAG